MVELRVLAVPDCPNAPVLLERLAVVLADYPEARLVRHVIRDEADAARLGMHGSPTVLVNGADPFASPGTPASVSCRVYRDEAGQAVGAPSVEALRIALVEGAGLAGRPVLPGAAGRAGLGRLAPADGGLRVVQQRVLRAFAETGPAVFSMCAIDALGVAAMLGRAVTISSAEPGTGTAITVTVPAGKGRAVWEPASTVVFAGRQDTAGPCDQVPPAAADECCGVINFFTTRERAAAWAGAHPGIAGQTLSQKQALKAAIQIFGPLLRT